MWWTRSFEMSKCLFVSLFYLQQSFRLPSVHSVSCRDRPPGPFVITDCCFFRVFSSIKSRPLSNFTFSKTSITVYSYHSLVDDNCRTSFCSKKLDNRALFHKVVISRRRHFLTDRDRCTHITTSLIVNEMTSHRSNLWSVARQLVWEYACQMWSF